MTLKAVLQWQNIDSTAEMNARFAAGIDKGILTGGVLSPVAGQLKVNILPFSALSNDGMLVTSDASIEVIVTIDQTNIVAMLAKHNIGAAPTLSAVVYEISVFNGLINKADHLVFGAVTPLSPAIQVVLTDISYGDRTAQDRHGRKVLRGALPSTLDLPADPSFNLPGDCFIVTAGSGDLPDLYSWDGLGWINISDTGALATALANHRANMFSNEIHLTDDQADAALGSSGTPSLLNRYVTEIDTRLPTQPENDALVGSHGIASSTNKYVTEEYPVAAPTLVLFPAPVGTNIFLSNTEGPFFVGNGAVGSANGFFSLMNFSSNIGYVNTANTAPQLTGIFKDILLTMPLNPAVDATSTGFFSADLYLNVDATVDSSSRLVYGKQSNLKTILKNFTVAPTPDFEVISSKVIELITNIKGYPFYTSVPTNEQNINLGIAINGLKAYIGSVLRTNVVATNEDFIRLESDPLIGSFFVKNIGVPPVYTFSNTGLVAVSYSSTTGIVTYASPVNLSGVRVGDVWQDGIGAEYLVVSVNDGLDQIGITDIQTGETPDTVSTSVGTAVDASTRINFNPRDLLLSEMKFSFGTEVIALKEIVRKTDEFQLPSGNVAYGIREHDGRLNPRIVLFGAWETYVAPSRETYIRNAGSIGTIDITGFLTDVVLVMRQRPDGPVLSVSVDHLAPTLVDTTQAGFVSVNVAAAEGAKYHRLVVATGLPANRPSHVSISISTPGVGSFDLYGIEAVRKNSATLALLESGRAFQNAVLVQRDAVDTAVAVSGLTALQRGGRRVYSLANGSYNTAIESLSDLDESNLPAGTATGTTVLITVGTGKLVNYNTGDLIQLASATVAEIRQILSIVGTTITLTAASSFVGAAVVVRHIASTYTTAPNPGEEDPLVSYNLLKDFIDHTTYDLETSDLRDRFIVGKDEFTILSGQNIRLTTTDITGTTRAVQVDSADAATMSFLVTATRMDLMLVSETAGSFNISIDGSPAYSVAFPGGTAQRKTLFFNARYQSHEVLITPTVGSLNLSEMFLFGPHRPSTPGFPCETSDLSLIAAYDSSKSIFTPPYVFPTGGVFHEGSAHLRYVDGTGINNDWALSLDFAKARYGKYVVADNEDAAVEFHFLGDTFELQCITGPDHGIFKITVDGVALQLAGGTVIGDYTGNQVDAYSATYSRKNIGAQGLSFGYHTVKAAIQNPRTKNVASADFKMAFTGYYVCNNLGTYSFGIGHDGVYTSLTDLRDFLPLDIPLAEDASVVTAKVLERSAIVTLTAATTSVSIILAEPYPDDNYLVNVNLMNLVDAFPDFQPLLVTALSASGFTVKWNAPLLSGNYKLAYSTRSV